jgi:hypothetical protein
VKIDFSGRCCIYGIGGEPLIARDQATSLQGALKVRPYDLGFIARDLI